MAAYGAKRTKARSQAARYRMPEAIIALAQAAVPPVGWGWALATPTGSM